mgnify:CR=1 FL=1
MDGSIQPIKGALPIAIKAREDGFEGLIIPQQNAREAAVVNQLKVYGVSNIREVIEFFNNERELEPTVVNTREEFYAHQSTFEFDFADVKGQENVKRALEVAAAGGHNLIMIGAPGSGKSMMAKRLPSILPPLSLGESLETTKIHSVAGKLGAERGLLSQRPFRAPHHMTSQVALIGGGQSPQPGEVSLAHNGVLFLDELPEFGRSVLEVLRQPLEDKKIVVSRARYSVEYPANFTLVAAMNPCPCGFFPDRSRCSCTPMQIQNYLNRLSRPILERFDICVEAAPVSFLELEDQTMANEDSATIRSRVEKAVKIQNYRFQGTDIHSNSRMGQKEIQRFCQLKEAERRFARKVYEARGISARGYHRVLKTARTIADLAGEEWIQKEHLSEAFGYRALEERIWGQKH